MRAHSHQRFVQPFYSLIAEAHADAAEAAKRIVPDPEGANPVELALLQAIKNLAQGNLIAVVRPRIAFFIGARY